MNEDKLLQKINNVIDETPIEILDDIKQAPRTKMLRADEIIRQSNEKEKIRPYALIAAIFLVFIINWQGSAIIPAGQIYLDVNPSIVLTFNQKNEVIQLQANNLAGQDMIKEIDFKGQPIKGVIGKVLDKMVEKNYLTADKNYLLLAVKTGNEKLTAAQKQTITAIISQRLRAKEIESVVLNQSLDSSQQIEKLAEKYNISISRMTFIKNIIQLNEDLSEEDLVKLPLADLVKLRQGNNLSLVQ